MRNETTAILVLRVSYIVAPIVLGTYARSFFLTQVRYRQETGTRHVRKGSTRNKQGNGTRSNSPIINRSYYVHVVCISTTGVVVSAIPCRQNQLASIPTRTYSATRIRIRVRDSHRSLRRVRKMVSRPSPPTPAVYGANNNNYRFGSVIRTIARSVRSYFFISQRVPSPTQPTASRRSLVRKKSSSRWADAKRVLGTRRYA